MDVGRSIKIDCYGDDISWYFEQSKFHPQSPPISKGGTLRINSATIEDAGNYFCYGKSLESDKMFLAKSTVVVYGKFDMLFIRNIKSTHLLILHRHRERLNYY